MNIFRFFIICTFIWFSNGISVAATPNCLGMLVLAGNPETTWIPQVSLVDDAKRIAHEITKKFPPNEFFYVGVGRSPVLFATIVSIFYPDQTVLLPLSRFKYPEQLLPEDHVKLHEHLKSFLPSRAQLAGKRILLMDYVATGSSLKNAERVVGDFYGDSQLIATAAIVTSDIYVKNNFVATEFFPVRDGSFRASLTYRFFSKWSPFGTFKPPFELSLFNIEYLKFKAAVKEMIENDITVK